MVVRGEKEWVHEEVKSIGGAGPISVSRGGSAFLLREGPHSFFLLTTSIITFRLALFERSYLQDSHNLSIRNNHHGHQRSSTGKGNVKGSHPTLQLQQQPKSTVDCSSRWNCEQQPRKCELLEIDLKMIMMGSWKPTASGPDERLRRYSLNHVHDHVVRAGSTYSHAATSSPRCLHP